MFIGHFAPAFAIRAASQDAPKLGTLFLAAQLVDWVFILLALVGIERFHFEPGASGLSPFSFDYFPISHSLAGTASFAVAFALVILWFTRNGLAALCAGTVVLSHWILDWLVHRPDLTIAGGERKLGLSLWNYPALGIAIETIITLAGFWLYMRRTKGPIVPPFILISTLLLVQGFTWFGPEPHTTGPFYLIGALMVLSFLTFLAAWVGATRWHKNRMGLAVASLPR